MSASFRRFEILLPRQFNDGGEVPDELIADTLIEIEERFGAVSSDTQITQGLWRHEGVLFRDELIKVFVDAPDDEASRQFFVELKERSKARFKQKDIWVTTYPVDVL